jgi:hypothetical protein
MYFNEFEARDLLTKLHIPKLVIKSVPMYIYTENWVYLLDFLFMLGRGSSTSE